MLRGLITQLNPPPVAVPVAALGNVKVKLL
jgi:hypothetical protein